MAAGVCAECGQSVAIDEIRVRSRAARRRIWIKRGIGTVVLIGALFGLYRGGKWAINAGYHYRLYTNTMLIDGYPMNSAATPEILRRLGLREFDDREFERLVEKSFTLELSTRTPRPRGLRAALNLGIKSNQGSLFVLGINHDGFVDSLTARLDRVPCELSSSSTRIDSFMSRYSIQTIDASIEFDEIPAVGSHQFDVQFKSVGSAVDPQVSQAIASYPEPVVQFQKSTNFEVMDCSVCDLIKCLDSQDDVNHLRDEFRMAILQSTSRLGSEAGLRYYACAVSPDTKQRFFVRIQQLDGTAKIGVIKCSLMFPVFSQDGFHSIFGDFSLRGYDTVVCRWAVDISSAFNNGADSIYPFELEWTFHDLNNLPEFQSECECNLPCARAPDRIVRVDNADGSITD